MKKEEITVQDILDIFEYDRLRGTLTRKRRQGSAAPNTIAGVISPYGYMATSVKGYRCFVHRLIWFIENGYWPVIDIDHVNGDKCDNRIENLRLGCRSENNANSKKPKNNTSGFKGAYFDKRRQRWAAEIWVFKNKKFLGYHDTAADAGAAYAQAARDFYGDFARV